MFVVRSGDLSQTQDKTTRGRAYGFCGSLQLSPACRSQSSRLFKPRVELLSKEQDAQVWSETRFIFWNVDPSITSISPYGSSEKLKVQLGGISQLETFASLVISQAG